MLGSGKKKRLVRKNPVLYSSPRTTSKRHSYNIKPLLSLVKYFLPILFLVYITFYSQYFSLNSIEVSGNNEVKTEDITKHVSMGQNIFLINTKDIEPNIINNIPEISSAKVFKGIPNALKIVVEENQPSLLWVSGDKNYLINSNGLAYKNVTTTDPKLNNLPKVIDERGLPVNIRERIVSKNFLKFIQNINDNMHALTNLQPEVYSINETTIDLNVKTKDNLIIKLDSLRSYSRQLENLKIILMEKRNEIYEYVDLRVNGWVYIK